MKLDQISEAKATATANKGKKFLIIGNPGRSQPSALYPKTEAPKLYTEAEAKRICDKLNDSQSKITYGAIPSQTHWHYKSLDVAMGYVMGSKATTSIKLLMPPDDEGWGSGPAKGRWS
jgi:hypothetical protein